MNRLRRRLLQQPWLRNPGGSEVASLRGVFDQAFQQLKNFSIGARRFVRIALDPRLTNQRAQMLAIDRGMLIDQFLQGFVVFQQFFAQRFHAVHGGGFLTLLLAVFAEQGARAIERFVVMTTHDFREKAKLAFTCDVRSDAAEVVDFAQHVFR